MSHPKLKILGVNVCKTFKRRNEECRALNGISFGFEEGESVAILGESGSGKSTLIRCLLGLEPLSSGELWVGNVPLHDRKVEGLRELRKTMAWIAQDYHLLSSHTVFDNIALPLRLARAEESYIAHTCEHLLSLVGLSEKRNGYPAQLSGGQQQRVAIARALTRKPEILLCDEPTSALDPFTTRSILDLLQKIKKELNLTIVLVTHHRDVAETLCHRMLELKQGKIEKETGLNPVLAREVVYGR